MATVSRQLMRNTFSSRERHSERGVPIVSGCEKGERQGKEMLEFAFSG